METFDQEEGRAAGGRLQRSDQSIGPGLLGNGAKAGQKAADIRDGQRFQCERHRRDIGRHGAFGGAARREQEDGRSLEAARQRTEDAARSAVEPMGVIHHQRQRGIVGHRTEQFADREGSLKKEIRAGGRRGAGKHRG